MKRPTRAQAERRLMLALAALLIALGIFYGSGPWWLQAVSVLAAFIGAFLALVAIKLLARWWGQ